MKKLLRKIFGPLLIWMADRFSSAPKQPAVFKSLSKLYKDIIAGKTSKGLVIDLRPTDQFIIFSDQHKGEKSGSDDFRTNETNYIAALNHYREQNFTLINLGDAEELWKFGPLTVIKNNPLSLNAESQFHSANKYYRTFGNHDLLWKNKLDVMLYLKNIFRMPLPVYEGLILKTAVTTKDEKNPLHIFLTHGHQGDKMSDNNVVSTWIIAHIWSPLQRFLSININTPAKNFFLRDKHNRIMYDWSKQRKNTLLITGHTHKPVFASGKYAVKTEHKIEPQKDEELLFPTYFNTGCCCYNDGDITGIEIDHGYIRLIKWHNDNDVPIRVLLEERSFDALMPDMPGSKD